MTTDGQCEWPSEIHWVDLTCVLGWRWRILGSDVGWILWSKGCLYCDPNFVTSPRSVFRLNANTRGKHSRGYNHPISLWVLSLPYQSIDPWFRSFPIRMIISWEKSSWFCIFKGLIKWQLSWASLVEMFE